MSLSVRNSFFVLMCVLGASSAFAQMRPAPYGAPVTLESARAGARACIAEATKNNWSMAVAIVDTGGHLVYFERMDGTQHASANIAIDKARSAVLFKRPTKAFQDAIAKGGENFRVLGLQGAIVAEGGVPIDVGGQIVGAVGLSGGTGEQDSACAAAVIGSMKAGR
jgi:uncharacterized protein GlcG (DUF336 family)